MVMLTRLRQLAGKIEASEGVAETLANTDAKNFVIEPKVDFDPEKFEQDLALSTFNTVQQLVGKRPGRMTFKLPLKGSGVAATAPDWGKYFQASACGVNLLKSINIGAVTGGPFKHGEIITGGTSAGKGRVIINTATGASAILYVVTSGTLQSGETITGDISGATATTSSSPTTVGNVIEPISLSIPSLTLAGQHDNVVRKTLKGARGKFDLGFKVGQPVIAGFDFMGVESGIVDAALFSSIPNEPAIPPVFINTTYLIDSYAMKISGMDLSFDNTIVGRDDPASDRGLASFVITHGGVVKGSFDAEMVSVATYDFYTKMTGQSQVVLDTGVIGGTSGNKFRFYAPYLQIIDVKDEDRNGIHVAKCAFVLNGSQAKGNDQWALICQ